MKYNYRHAAVTVCHQLKVQSLRGEQMSFVVSTSSVSLGWQDGDYMVGFKSLPSASATNSELTTIKNQTLIYKLSVYHYRQVCSNCSRSPQEHPLQGRGPESHLTDHSRGNISWNFSFFISRSCSLQEGWLCWCRVTKVKFKYTVINRQQHYRKQDTHFSGPL